MTISAEVQAILDRAKQNSNLVSSVDLGMKGLSMQVADLQGKINSMPVGNVLSDEDKAALSEAASNLDTSIATLQKDIPANTQIGGDGSAPKNSGSATGSALDPNGNAATGGEPQPSDTGPQASDPIAQPLAGTGQS